MSATNAASVKLPGTIVWTAYDLSGLGCGHAVAMGKAIRDACGTPLRVISASTDISRLAPVRDGRAQFANTGSDVSHAVEGAFGYASSEWGPQPLQLVSSASSLNCLAMGGAKDANIRTPASPTHGAFLLTETDMLMAAAVLIIPFGPAADWYNRRVGTIVGAG